MKRFLGLLLLLNCTFRVSAQTLAQSTLPILVIETNGQAIPDEPKIPASLGLVYNGPGQINQISGPFNEYNGLIGIERRGSTSQLLFPKVPYAIELRDGNGNDQATALLGMPKESDWALITNYNDKSLIRDALAYTLAGRIMAYAPRCRFVEVVINGEYLGVFLLTERIKRDPNRVAVSKNKPDEDVTGGYILKLDKEEGDSLLGYWYSHVPPRYATFGQSIKFLHHYPRTEDLTPEQTQYIRQWMFDFEENLRGPDFADPDNGYRKFIDPATFIDFMWLNEAFKNVDGYRLSTFFYKDKDAIDGRLKMGPIWDFNLAFGNCNYCRGETTNDWMWNFNQYCPQDQWVIPFWWDRLREDTGFLIDAQDRWRTLRKGPLADQAVLATVDSLAGALNNGPRDRNFQRWPVLGQWVWPNNFVGQTYPEELNYLKNWFTTRLHWMDGAVEDLYRGIYYPAGFFEPVVQPNPARGKTRVVFYAKAKSRLSGALFDLQGREWNRFATVAEKANRQAIEIPLPEAAGVYFLRLELEGKKYVRKIVVQ